MEATPRCWRSSDTGALARGASDPCPQLALVLESGCNRLWRMGKVPG